MKNTQTMQAIAHEAPSGTTRSGVPPGTDSGRRTLDVPVSILGNGADIVAPGQQVSGKIVARLQQAPLLSSHDGVLPGEAKKALENVIPGLRTQTSFAPSCCPGAPSHTKAPSGPVSLQRLADKLLLDQYSPAAALVTPSGDILYLSAKAGKYLKLPAGMVNWNILAMTGDTLRLEMASCFQQALLQKRAVTRTHIEVGTDNAIHFVDLSVQVIDEPEPLRGMVIIVFADVDPSTVARMAGRGEAGPTSNIRTTHLQLELNQAREALRLGCEQMQSSHEQVRATNEELKSSNEQLQSSNEQLTTSKEQMQSLNEELQTLNTALESKVEDLCAANNDMKNLLNSTDVASIFLDMQLRIRRFTTEATRIIRLVPGDVGRPLVDIASALLYPELTEDAQEVLRTLVVLKKQFVTHDAHWYLVHIMPYRTLANIIDGVVITFTDCTTSKSLEAKLRYAQAESEERVAQLTEQLVSLREERRAAIGGQSFGLSMDALEVESEETGAELST